MSGNGYSKLFTVMVVVATRYRCCGCCYYCCCSCGNLVDRLHNIAFLCARHRQYTKSRPIGLSIRLTVETRHRKRERESMGVVGYRRRALLPKTNHKVKTVGKECGADTRITGNKGEDRTRESPPVRTPPNKAEYDRGLLRSIQRNATQRQTNSIPTPFMYFLNLLPCLVSAQASDRHGAMCTYSC